MKKVENRIKEILNETSKRDYQIQYLTKPSAFSRDSTQKMSFEEMTVFVMTNSGKTLSLEVLDFFSKYNKIEDIISKQALSEQRKYIDYKLFEDMNIKYIDRYFAEEENQTFEGYNLVAVDGSTSEIPNTKELKKTFGEARASKTSVSNARAGLNGFYDCLNQLMVTIVVDQYQRGEKTVFLENAEKVLEIYKDKNVLFIFDRGYICLELLIFLNELGIKYLFRVPSNCYKKELESATRNDENIDIICTTTRLKNLTKEKKKEYLEKGSITVRLAQVELDTGEIEYLVTNVDKEEIAYEKMKELYYKRWQIEKCFDVLKNRLQMENISSRSENGVKQEIHARVFVSNILQDFANCINKDIVKKEDNKYEYKININIFAGILTTYIMYLICTDVIEKKEGYYDELIKFIKRNLVPIRTGRDRPRIKKVSRNKHKPNIRRNM